MLKGEIISLRKQGYTKSDIGRILKEKYNIYDVRQVFGKRLSKLLEEWGFKEDIPEDLLSLFRKINRILKHLSVHKKDTHSKKDLEELESRVKCLIKYYKRIGKLPKEFEYSRDIVKMYS